LLIVSALAACSEESLKGRVILSLTDAPADAANVKAVNIVITNIEANKNGSWKSMRSFDQPIGINLLDFSGGKALQLLDQYLDPGKFNEIRFTLNVADRQGSLIRNPQCEISLTDGTTRPLFLPEGSEVAIVVPLALEVTSRGLVDFTLDFDVRKSVVRDERGNYVLRPVVRPVATKTAGAIELDISGLSASERVVVFAYQAARYAGSEQTGEIPFFNATSSARCFKKTTLAFLEPGSYDLVFARMTTDGNVQHVLGLQRNLTVASGEKTSLPLDLRSLGN